MPKFKFVDFSCNLLQIDNFVESKENHLIIYPTQNNANMAQAYSQNRWQFEDIVYIAIEDFKEMVLSSDKIFWEDDKRVIALYRLLTDEDKIFFKVTDFFDFIKLANKIFKLFEELAEELIDFSTVCQFLEEQNSTLFPWQIEYYERVHNLIMKYQAWITENKSNDKIFNLNSKNINIEYFSNYTNVVVVNQFYYTNLEKEILTRMEEAGKEVTLVYQLPEEFVDKKSFNAQPFKYQDLELLTSQQPKLELIIDRNRFTMMNSLCRIITEEKINQVIDREFYETPYAKLLSRDTFDIKYNKPIINTELYHFLEIIQLLLESIDYYNNQSYLPLVVIIQALLSEEIVKYFQIPNASSLVEELTLQRDKGILYCDIRGTIGKGNSSQTLKDTISKLISFLKSIKRVISIDGFIALFDTEKGIILDRICSPFDLKYSNIKEVIYTELANLKSFTNNNLIKDWSELSDKAEHRIIYKLFSDGLKAKTVKYTELESRSGVRVNSLLDSRNNRYDSLIFLNMVEGVLPTKRTIQFLFNEKQRELLTLKSYEAIRLREKYYFQRLVLSAKQCYFIGIENTDDDTSLSSFLEELPLIKPEQDKKQADTGYADLFSHNDSEILPLPDADFWSVKLSPSELSPNSSQIKLSYTKLSSLLDNPLYFVLRDWAKVQEKKLITDLALDYRFVGVFAQDFINHIIARIKDNFINQQVFYKFQFMSRERLSEIYDSFLRTYPDKDYYIPHNYSYRFLTSILKSALVEGMQNFFNIVMHYKLDLSEKKLLLIPEEGFSLHKSQKYKSFITESENNYQLGIAVTGDADLRIENLEDRSKVVIDFKTGTYSKEQLALYQFIYYWNEINLGEQVKAGIFQILKQEWVVQSKPAEDMISKLKEKVIDLLNEIAIIGFSLPESREKAKKYDKITRADLLTRR